jgi:hypothetical protein
MSTPSDGPGSRPVEDPVTQTGRPPVPPPVSSAAPTDDAPDGGQVLHTERVPFPLPGLSPADGPPRPPRKPAPDETGVLDLRGYPPRVPGRDIRPAEAEDGEDGADRGR